MGQKGAGLLILIAGIVPCVALAVALALNYKPQPELVLAAIIVPAAAIVIAGLMPWARKTVAVQARARVLDVATNLYSPGARRCSAISAQAALDEAEQAAERLRDVVGSLAAGPLSRPTKRRLVRTARSVNREMFKRRRRLQGFFD